MTRRPVTDRRRYKRLALNLSVVIRLGGPIEQRVVLEEEEIEVSAIDVSEGGLGIISKYLIPKHSLLHIIMDFTAIDLQGGVIFHKPLDVEGEVRSVVDWEGDQYRLGIKFTKITNEDKTAIKAFVRNFMHYKPPKIGR